jgi:hypothetical protein
MIIGGEAAQLAVFGSELTFAILKVFRKKMKTEQTFD